MEKEHKQIAHGKFLCDAPVEEDYLGNDSYCQGLAEYICTCSTPMTIAIQGDWGSGKTSVMNIVRKKLEEEEKSSVIAKTSWFNVWKYSCLSDNEDLFVPLVLKLENDLEEGKKGQAESTHSKSLLNTIWSSKPMNAAVNVTSILAHYLLDSKNLSGTTEEIVHRILDVQKDVDRENIEKSYHVYESIEKIHNELQGRVNEVIGNQPGQTSKDRRIVIFIDDLDRVRPTMAVNLLESLKNFFDCEHCVFVLALDRKIVERGLRLKYGEDIQQDYNRRFFDKIIQVPFNLPEYKYQIQEYLDALKENIPEIRASSEKQCRILNALWIRNPRTIKRALNNMQLNLEIMKTNQVSEMTLERPETQEQLFLLLLIEMEFPDVYETMRKAVLKDIRLQMHGQSFSQWIKEGEAEEKHANIVNGLAICFPGQKENEDEADAVDEESLRNMLTLMEDQKTFSRVMSNTFVELYTRLKNLGLKNIDTYHDDEIFDCGRYHLQISELSSYGKKPHINLYVDPADPNENTKDNAKKMEDLLKQLPKGSYLEGDSARCRMGNGCRLMLTYIDDIVNGGPSMDVVEKFVKGLKKSAEIV